MRPGVAASATAPPPTPIRKAPTTWSTHITPPPSPPPHRSARGRAAVDAPRVGGRNSRPCWTCQCGAAPPFTSAVVAAVIANTAMVSVCRYLPSRPGSDRDAAPGPRVPRRRGRGPPAAAATSPWSRNQAEVPLCGAEEPSAAPRSWPAGHHVGERESGGYDDPTPCGGRKSGCGERVAVSMSAGGERVRGQLAGWLASVCGGEECCGRTAPAAGIFPRRAQRPHNRVIAGQ